MKDNLFQYEGYELSTLAELEIWEERAAIKEYCGDMSRTEAEKQTREEYGQTKQR